MSRKIDWEAMYKQPMRGKRGGYASRKEQLQKAFSQMREHEAAQERFKVMEPLLKKSLLDHMVSRKPIQVIRPLVYFSEDLQKSGPESLGRFEVTRKVVEPGSTLVFQRIDKQLGQWIFKSSTGEEVEIYDSPTIQISPDHVVQNPGFWGLLTNTHLYDQVVKMLD